MNSFKFRDGCAQGPRLPTRVAILVCVVAAIAAAAVKPAFAEGQPESATQASSVSQPASQTSRAPAAQATTSLGAIVVTGSLIHTPNQVSASPILAVSLPDLKASTADSSLVTVLSQLPQFNADSSPYQNRSGLQFIDLRGLGSNRTLVLLDGRRLPLADIDGDVGINLIPAAAIGSTQIVTGGASAVYGSDAISGVVNFLTVPYFDGIKGSLQYGNSSENDYAQQQASIALGSSFDSNKGNVLLSFGYTDSQGLSGSNRSFFAKTIPSSYIGQGTFVPSATNLPSQAAVSALFAGYGVQSHVSNTQNLGFNNDGSLFVQNGAQNYKGPTSGAFGIFGGNVRMPVGPQTLIATPVKIKDALSKFDYELTPNFTVYGQFLYSSSDTLWNSGLSLTQFVQPQVPVTNPFVPADLQTLLASRPNPTAAFGMNWRFVGVPVRMQDEQYTTTQYLAGGKGNFGFGDWTYDVYASHDMTDHLSNINDAVLASRVQSLLSAPDGGNSICAGGLNPFGLENHMSISPACLGYMTTTTHSEEQLSQNIVQGQAQGSLFALPAGNVQMAVLADSRSESYQYTPDTSLAAGDIEATAPTTATQGKTEVNELATQFSVPLLSDMPFVKSLTTDVAYRYSKYNISGGVDTYEADLKWQPTDSLLLRGAYQRAIRAPNIGELFSVAGSPGNGSQAAATIGTPPTSVGDPCDIRSPARTGPGATQVEQLCMAQGVPAVVLGTLIAPTTTVPDQVVGNTGLTPEVARTYNYGFQWSAASSSALLQGMSLSVDYYNIHITNVISVVPAVMALSKCFNLDGSNPSYSLDNQFCELIRRNSSSGQISMVTSPYLNLGGLRTNGADLQFNWRPSLSAFGLSDSGSLFLTSYVNYTRSYQVQTIPGGPVQDYIGTLDAGTSIPHPHWKGLTTLGFENENFQVGLRWHYLGAMDESTVVTSPGIPPGPGMSVYNTYDLFGSVFLNNNLTLRLGVNNITNKRSIVVANTQNNTVASVYPPIGTMYYLGLDFTM